MILMELVCVDSNLIAKLPISNFSLKWEGLNVSHGEYSEICSISIRTKEVQALNSALKTEFKVSLPEPNRMLRHDSGCIFWFSRSQWFITSDSVNPYFDKDLIKIFKGQPSITLQTDGWTPILLVGEKCKLLLERLVKINLCEQNFPKGSSTRTVCSHINIILQRPFEVNKYMILVERSYAKSLLDNIYEAGVNFIGTEPI